MDRRARWATVHGVSKSQTRLSDFTFTFTFKVAKELKLLNCKTEKTLESLLDCKEIKLVNPKGNQP